MRSIYRIIEEHAWIEADHICAKIVLSASGEETILLCGQKGESSHYFVDHTEESYDSYEDARHSAYADYFAIIERMMNECNGKMQRVSYEIRDQYSRMTDNVYEKIPEAEIELSFLDGSSLFAFAYQTASYEEYALSKKSWFFQEEEGLLNRQKDILESYDSFQDSLHSHYPEIFFTLREMLENEVEYDLHFGEDLPEEEEY